MRLDRENAAAVGALLLVHVAWGVLLWMQSDLFCFSDCPVETLPRLIATARSVQSGAIPFWDVNTFAGARPFWLSTGSIYFPLSYPLFLLTDTGNPSQAFVLLQLFPYAVHLAAASVGGYFFARHAMRLAVPGAVVVALAFPFSRTLLHMDFISQPQGYSYLPWILLAAVRTLDSGSRRAWAAGALLVGALCFVANPDTVNRTMFLVGLQAAGYWLVSRWRVWSGRDVARLFALLLMACLGMATYTFGFAGILWGISMALGKLSLSCHQVAAFAEYSSVPPAALLGLFYPPLFAASPSEISDIEVGALLLSVAFAAVVGARRASTETRYWTLLATFVAAFGGLVALGYHTPFFGWMCRALPPVFGFPHPSCYTVAVSWGLALLGGVGVSALTTSPPSRAMLVLCSWPLLAAAGIAVVRPDIPFFSWEMPFVSVSTYVIATVLVLLVAAGVPQRLRGRVICAGVVAEILLSPFYLALNPPFGEPVHWMDHTKWTLAHNNFTELRPILGKIAGEDAVRFVGTRAVVDAQSWVVDGRGLFGLSAKPVLPHFEQAVSSFTVNAPNILWLVGLPRFLQNMNVGYLVADREPTYHEYLSRDYAHFDAAVARLPLIEQTAHWDIRAIPSPVPYVYTQDRVFVATPDEQRQHVLDTDLRQGAYVNAEVDAWLAARGAGLAHERANPEPDHFDQLQKANVISPIDRSNPNRKRIQIDVQSRRCSSSPRRGMRVGRRESTVRPPRSGRSTTCSRVCGWRAVATSSSSSSAQGSCAMGRWRARHLCWRLRWSACGGGDRADDALRCCRRRGWGHAQSQFDLNRGSGSQRGGEARLVRALRDRCGAAMV